MKQSRKVAVSGMICALSMATLFLSVVPYLTFAVPAVAGALFIVLVIELSGKWAFGAYFVTAVLSLLVCPDKEAAAMFVCFFGYYPILKSILEKIRLRVVEVAIKLLVFNASVIVAYIIIVYIIGIPFEGMDDFGKYTLLVLLAGGNVMFVLYDVALTRAISGYGGRVAAFFRRK